MQVGQISYGAGVRVVGKFAAEGVLHKVDVRQVARDFAREARAAVGFGVSAKVGDLVAVGGCLDWRWWLLGFFYVDGNYRFCAAAMAIG